MEDVLNAALREYLGAEARLEEWAAQPASKRGKQRAVRYDLDARAAGAPQACRYEWVGKFYEQDDDARRVARVLRELAATDCCARGGLMIPSVLAYHAPLRLLLLTYQSGESVIGALVRDRGLVLPALGRALAALHATSVTLDRTTSAVVVLDDLRRRVAGLCGRFPEATASLRQRLKRLEQRAPCGFAGPTFLHGDLGPAQLLWQTGRVVVLDFDKCTRGDPALDLGNLLTQLRRLTLRKPDKLPGFVSLRRELLDAYQRWYSPDPGLAGRVAWYEEVLLLRKIHFLVFDATRHAEPGALQRRQAEANRLLEELPALIERA